MPHLEAFFSYNKIMIVGIDEVGRGPWAGPLVVGAVVLSDHSIEGLTDSKMLSKKKREYLAPIITKHAQGYGLGWVTAEEIDEIGLAKSLTEATKRALEQITVPYNQIIIDGTVNFLKDTGKGPYVTTMKKADLLISAVSAASILAKVARDDYMEQQDLVYDGYDFTSHVGYGTAKHRAAIEQQGITPLHRRSFAPIAALIGEAKENYSSKKLVSNKQTGNDAENAVATWLESKNYRIVDRNWRTKFCEIDIVAEKAGTLYFVEVKHRKDAARGGGLAAITSKKHNQMRFAAEVYSNYHSLAGKDMQLAVVCTNGSPIVIEELLKIT